MADDGVELKVTNAAGFASMLTGVVKGLGDMKGPLEAAGTVILPAARAAAPKRSGNLQAAHSGRYLGRNRWRLTVDVPYAAAVHWGWPAHGIRRQPWVVASFLRDQSWMERMDAAQQAALDKEAAKT